MKSVNNYTEYELEKMAFVDKFLSPMISASGIGWKECMYVVDDNDNELVVATSEANTKKIICVTADSISGLVYDVVNKLY